jgi:4'-phosphopantetheinyl transferase
MIRIYFAITGPECDTETSEKLIATFPQSIINKIAAYKNRADRQSRILGKLMLVQLIKDFGLGLSIHDLRYSPFNKPYFDARFNFSIAHAGGMVACAATIDHPIGIDIEKNNPIDIALYREQLTASEWSLICHASDTQGAFYNIWTKKEALLKALGRGVDADFSHIDVSGDEAAIDNTTYRFSRVEIGEGYVCHMATTGAGNEIEAREFFV